MMYILSKEMEEKHALGRDNPLSVPTQIYSVCNRKE